MCMSAEGRAATKLELEAMRALERPLEAMRSALTLLRAGKDEREKPWTGK